jgi:hypothetical protein
MRNMCLHTRETDFEACVGALSDFKTEPQILTQLPANPTLRAARWVGMTPYLEGVVVRETR